MRSCASLLKSLQSAKINARATVFVKTKLVYVIPALLEFHVLIGLFLKRVAPMIARIAGYVPTQHVAAIWVLVEQTVQHLLA